MTNIKNLFNLPPDMFDLVYEKSQDPEDPALVYQVLCQEIEIQISQARDHPEEGGRFQTIMQCALILESLRKDAAVRMKLICKECFEPLTNDGDGRHHAIPGGAVCTLLMLPQNFGDKLWQMV